MKLVILKTNIKSHKKVSAVQRLLNGVPSILKWNIDLEDIDSVLKIQTRDDVQENDIIHLIKSRGFYCEALPE